MWEQPWPQADPALLEREQYELVCQVNGKLRDRVSAPADAGPEQLKELCRAAPNVRAHLDGKEIVKEIVVPGKLVNSRRALARRARRRIHSRARLKPAYLIHGDDHGAVAERRAGLQALALKQGDAGSVEAARRRRRHSRRAWRRRWRR